MHVVHSWSLQPNHRCLMYSS